MKYCFFFALAFIISVQAKAQSKQERPNYQLLWKISGKDLKKPSYLFGTMHVQDKRAFDFSDSVIHKILECESFALEVHPDSATKVMFLEMVNNQENSFRKLLSPADYRELDSLLVLKTGQTLDDLKSPLMAEVTLSKRFDRADKETFLDAWLYLYARNQNKKIFGLEDARKHMNIVMNSPRQNIKSTLIRYLTHGDSMRPAYRKLFDLYHEGDLSGIEKFITDTGKDEPEFYNKLLLERNQDMLNSIRATIHNRTAFMAVGAAHLHGKDGLIELLRNAGYEVTLVKPTFTGLSRKIKIDVNPEVWNTYSFDQGGYSLQMPGAPFQYKLDSIGLIMDIYMDMKGPTLFQTMHTLISSQGKSVQEMFDRIEKNMTDKAQNLAKGKRYKINGHDALEIQIIKAKQFFRAVYVVRGSVLCMLMVGPTKEIAYGANADRFIKSFKSIDLKKNNWELYQDKTGAYTVMMNGKPKQINRTSSDGNLNQDVFITMSENLPKGEVYLARYSDFPIGYLSTDDSVYHASAIETFMSRMEGKNLRRVAAVMDGHPAVEYTFDSGSGTEVRARMTLRGNRFYMVMATAEKNKVGTSDNDFFLDSFRFMEFQRTGLKPYDIEDIHAWLPTAPHYDSTGSTETVKVYNSVDPNSGILFALTKAQLDPYRSSESKEEFFKADYVDEEGDSIVWTRDLSKGDIVAHEFIVQSNKTNAVRRIRTIAQGRDLYSVSVAFPVNYKGDLEQRFFDSLAILPNPKSSKWHILARKTNQLLNDLNSIDSTANKEAHAALWDYDFTPSEIPMLYAAIENPATLYRDKNNLLAELKDLNDSTTLDFIARLYPTLPDSNNVREEALGVLSYMKNQEGALLLLRLIKNDQTGSLGAGYTTLGGYYDSLSLLEPIAVGLLQSHSKFEGCGYLYSLLIRGIEEGVFSQALSQQVKHEFLRMATAKVKAGLQTPDEEDDLYYTLNYDYEQTAAALKLLAFTQEVKGILEALTDTKMEDVMLQSIPLLLKNGVKVNPAYLNSMASNPIYRADFWTALVDVNQDKFFPRKYRTQEKLAEGLLVRYMNYDDYIPEKTELAGTQWIKHDGVRKKIFAFRCYDGETWYLGLSGPYIDKEIIPVEEEFVFNTYIQISPKDDLSEKVKKALEDYEGVEIVK